MLTALKMLAMQGMTRLTARSLRLVGLYLTLDRPHAVALDFARKDPIATGV
jgi:hypothetical protein